METRHVPAQNEETMPSERPTTAIIEQSNDAPPCRSGSDAIRNREREHIGSPRREEVVRALRVELEDGLVRVRIPRRAAPCQANNAAIGTLRPFSEHGGSDKHKGLAAATTLTAKTHAKKYNQHQPRT
jgi:hypothetical protein